MNTDEFKDIIEHCGYEIRKYRGRGQSRQCLAVSDAESLLSAVCNIIDAAESISDGPLNEVLTIIRGTEVDTLGMGIILYWPSIPWENSWDNDEESGE